MQGGTLEGKFVYPDPGQGSEWKLNSLPGIVLTHGYNGSFAEMETVATELARHCFSVLIYNYRGQGPVYDAETRFNAYGEPERQDLAKVTQHFTETHPVSNTVDATRMGLIGPSQGGLVTWLGIADNSMRGNYLAAVPYNGEPMSAESRFPQDCMSGGVALAFVPNAVRTPWAGPTPTGTITNTPGVSWDAGVYATYSGALMTHTPDLPVQQTAVATRAFLDELATGTPGTPHPHVYAQVSWYDANQWADANIAGWQTLTPAPGSAPGYPRKRILIGTGGHNDPPWDNNNERERYQRFTRYGWLWDYLHPTYDPAPTASPTPTDLPPSEPTRTPTPTITNTPRPTLRPCPSSSPVAPTSGRRPPRPSPCTCAAGRRRWRPRPAWPKALIPSGRPTPGTSSITP